MMKHKFKLTNQDWFYLTLVVGYAIYAFSLDKLWRWSGYNLIWEWVRALTVDCPAVLGCLLAMIFPYRFASWVSKVISVIITKIGFKRYVVDKFDWKAVIALYVIGLLIIGGDVIAIARAINEFINSPECLYVFCPGL